ncbi:methylated-DNA--[protein]-cysteine S-methyltransferase [Pseudoalteromonas sp. MMG013]|nr:methylated-DNA--[protein]-cysteine S-methyltransferase [Pseudoalteromonas sp. MMG012]MBQ4863623.1 methylated-DNA--[protein]-cysteine S-methyltransferase [Pseudoalteromonas sp. MMG013]
MKNINIQYFKHPYAEFILGSFDNTLCLCDFRYRAMRRTIDTRIKHTLNADFIEKSDDITTAAEQQLTQYFMAERRHFDIPLRMVGNDFQQSVWQTLTSIPYGGTATYDDLAKHLPAKYTTQNIHHANGANALAIIVPCHRILDISGSLVGYGGGLSLKKRLLDLEHNLFNPL